MNARKAPGAPSGDAAAGDRAVLEALVLRDALGEHEIALFKQVFGHTANAGHETC